MKNKINWALLPIATASSVIAMSCSSSGISHSRVNSLFLPNDYIGLDYITMVDGKIASFDSTKLLSDLSVEFSKFRQFTSEFGYQFKNWIQNFGGGDSTLSFFNVMGVVTLNFSLDNNNNYSLECNLEINATGDNIEIPLSFYEEDLIISHDSLLNRIIDVHEWTYLFSETNNFIIMDRFNYLEDTDAWWLKYIQRKADNMTFYTNMTKEEYTQYISNGGLSITSFSDVNFQDVFSNEAMFGIDQYLKLTHMVMSNVELIDKINLGNISLHFQANRAYVNIEIILKNDESIFKNIISNVFYVRHFEE